LKRIAHIAVVEDDQAVRQSLTSLIRSLGYRASAYPSAEAFLDTPAAERPDVLITDLQMPGLSGLEMLRELDRLGRAVPSILMTAFPDESARSASLALGVEAFLAKPANGDAIADLLARILTPAP
jgi:FixJ family two-component response regulator